ncbi:MAG TPA: exodeoxyribonuclease VII large subunit, partial [Terrimicrobiaceae bacterium]
PLPRFPRRVGLVTSPTGAAIRDFLKVLHRRHPGIEVLIHPVRVQGRGASWEIARAIRDFGDWLKTDLLEVDVIVLTRGGGSIEDLWEFNEEIVARAIAASPIPVLSAIGHEIDFTISDFVADLRAPTPSAAAEILAADRLEVLIHLKENLSRLARAGTGRLELLAARLKTSRQSSLFREPLRRVLEFFQTLDRRTEAFRRAAMLRLERDRNRLDRLTSRVVGILPARAIADRQFRCQLLAERIPDVVTRELAARRARLERAVGVLHAMSPQATLTRGYTITMDADRRPLTSATAIQADALLKTRFHDGEAVSIAAKR